jgi:hypothetical protein
MVRSCLYSLLSVCFFFEDTNKIPKWEGEICRMGGDILRELYLDERILLKRTIKCAFEGIECISYDSGYGPMMCFYENVYEIEIKRETFDQLRNVPKNPAQWSKNFIQDKVRRQNCLCS